MSKRHLGRRGWEGIHNLPTPKTPKQTLSDAKHSGNSHEDGVQTYTQVICRLRAGTLACEAPALRWAQRRRRRPVNLHRFSSCNQAAWLRKISRISVLKLCTCMAMLKLLLRKTVPSSKQRFKQAKPTQNQFAENRTQISHANTHQTGSPTKYCQKLRTTN